MKVMPLQSFRIGKEKDKEINLDNESVIINNWDNEKFFIKNIPKIDIKLIINYNYFNYLFYKK